MNKDSKIYVAGHMGLVGSAILKKLEQEGYNNIVTRTSEKLNLTWQPSVYEFFHDEIPEYVFLCAAKVGGVLANKENPATFIYENLAIQNNVINYSRTFGIKKLMFLGSNCLYPRLAVEPLREGYLMAGKLEVSTEAYAIAKLAGIKMCQAYRTQYGCNYISVLPVNMYGENDNFNLQTSHVMPALIGKFKTAKKEGKPFVEVWGSGNQRREFLHADDLADACLFLMNNYNDSEPINIGTGRDMSIKELALLIKDIVGYEGELVFNTSKPEGSSGKLLDVTKINNLGWSPKIGLREGIKRVYDSL